MAPVTHSYIWNRYAGKTVFGSLTKIERQEIILSIEYSIIFIAVFVDKLQYRESYMHKCINNRGGWTFAGYVCMYVCKYVPLPSLRAATPL